MESLDLGLLLLRLVFGPILMAHGCRKLLGWFNGPGLEKAAAMFDAIGYRPGRVLVAVASVSEIAGGLLLLTGAWWPLGPMTVIGTMLVAASTHRVQGFWASQGGAELPLAYSVVAAGLLFAGPGTASLSPAPEIDLTWPIQWSALVAALAGAGALLFYRRFRAR